MSGIDRAESYSLDALDLIKSSDQVKEGFAGGTSEITGIDSGKDYFLDSFCCNCFSLRDDVSDRDIATLSTSIRYGTVMTFIVTSVLHLEE